MADASTPTPENPEKTPEPAPDADPQIHVDAEWKAQARADKERLAREAAAAPETPADAAGPTDDPNAGRLPGPSFVSLVQTLATQALIFMSNERDPHSGRSLRNLDLAKHNVELLGVLEQKTAGNLTDDEKRFLDRTLYELRMAYVGAAS